VWAECLVRVRGRGSGRMCDGHRQLGAQLLTIKCLIGVIGFFGGALRRGAGGGGPGGGRGGGGAGALRSRSRRQESRGRSRSRNRSRSWRCRVRVDRGTAAGGPRPGSGRSWKCGMWEWEWEWRGSGSGSGFRSSVIQNEPIVGPKHETTRTADQRISGSRLPSCHCGLRWS
jgi:hypothetical protein